MLTVLQLLQKISFSRSLSVDYSPYAPGIYIFLDTPQSLVHLTAFPPAIMSEEPSNSELFELASEEIDTMTSSESGKSSSSPPANLFYLLPPELRLQIYDLVNEGQGQLHYEYQRGETLSLEALTECLKINAHITMQTEVGFLNKPKRR
jgi:hypothetical protein